MQTSTLVIFVIVPLAAYAAVITMALLHTKQKQHKQQSRKLLSTSEESREQTALLLHQKADEATRLSQSIQKFVPHQFMHHLQSGQLDKLELGHAVEDEVAILFCDIRGFTSMSEELAPKDLIRFLNSYFFRMNGPIHQNNGFIDKFIGDAIMALFDHPDGSNAEKAKDAVNAALELQQATALYNEHRENCDYPPISIGIGLHFGTVTFGTVGSDDRMDTTVIGDNVNLASRIESQCSKYSSEIVISKETLDILGPALAPKTRLLDYVKVKGRSKPVTLHEIIEHLPQQEQTRRIQTETFIQKALQARAERDWDKALGLFYLALQKKPNDPLIEYHIQLCSDYQQRNLPEDWDGASVA